MYCVLKCVDLPLTKRLVGKCKTLGEAQQLSYDCTSGRLNGRLGATCYIVHHTQFAKIKKAELAELQAEWQEANEYVRNNPKKDEYGEICRAWPFSVFERIEDTKNL